MRRHELPSPLLFCPTMRRMKLTDVSLIVCFADQRRAHSHNGSVPVKKYFYLIVTSPGLRLGGLSGRFLTGESLRLVRYFAVRERKHKIVTPQMVKDCGILFDQRLRQLTLQLNQLTFKPPFGWRRIPFSLR